MKGLLLRAAVIGAAWCAMHLAGWREHMAAPLSLGDRAPWYTLLQATLYATAHFLLVFVAPVLVLAAVLLFASDRLKASRA